jgi:hypothetical protein
MGTNRSQPQHQQQTETIEPPHPMMNNTKLIARGDSVVLRSEWPFFSEEAFEAWQKRH